jgi:hypothetical protein
MIGHWANNQHPEYPVPVENSATPNEVALQLMLLSGLCSGRPEIRYRGWSTCRICRCKNGTYAFETTRGEIPVGLKHYIETHNVLVPGLLEVE